mmetsp:Transcript_2321/g.6427  ORF Transcript_2321/g.6427 Transcript_2321/m.6427 type:complete len:336 (+) Transcript_2321:1480-2487(+)
MSTAGREIDGKVEREVLQLLLHEERGGGRRSHGCSGGCSERLRRSEELRTWGGRERQGEDCRGELPNRGKRGGPVALGFRKSCGVGEHYRRWHLSRHSGGRGLSAPCGVLHGRGNDPGDRGGLGGDLHGDEHPDRAAEIRGASAGVWPFPFRARLVRKEAVVAVEKITNLLKQKQCAWRRARLKSNPVSQLGLLLPLDHGLDRSVGLTRGKVHVVVELAGHRVERIEVQVWHIQQNPVHRREVIDDGLAHLVQRLLDRGAVRARLRRPEESFHDPLLDCLVLLVERGRDGAVPPRARHRRRQESLPRFRQQGVLVAQVALVTRLRGLAEPQLLEP